MGTPAKARRKPGEGAPLFRFIGKHQKTPEDFLLRGFAYWFGKASGKRAYLTTRFSSRPGT